MLTERLPDARCLDLLQNFIDSVDVTSRMPRSQWLMVPGLDVYVRRGFHLIEGDLTACLDLASLNATPMRKGIGTRFITAAHEMNPWRVTYIESVLNPHLVRWLDRNDWMRIESMAPSYYKLKD